MDEPPDNWPPLWTALTPGNFDAVRHLVSEGARLEDLIEDDGGTLLHHAALFDDHSIIDFYLEHGSLASLQRFDSRGQTPLICAAASGRTDVVYRLLNAGVDPNRYDTFLAVDTAIAEAVSGCHPLIVSLLLDAGADPTLPGWMGLTAVDRAMKLQPVSSAKVQQIHKLLAGYLD